MNEILVRPQELRQISERLLDHAKKIDSALQAIDQEIASLKGNKFLGSRADALQARYAPKRKALLKAKQTVAHFAEDLKTAANVFEQADNPAKSTYSASNQSNSRPVPGLITSIPPRKYALFSQAAYSDSPELPDELKSEGWEVLYTAKDLGKDQDGYFGVAFVNSKTGEVVIAHRGSDQWNFNPFNGKSSDVDDDLSIRLGRIPDQYDISREFVDAVKDRLKDDARFSDYTLTHTGHSLGAALSDLNAITDNVKGIGFDNPGTLQIIN